MLGPRYEPAIISISKENLKRMQGDYEKHKKATPAGVEVRPFEEVLGAFAVMGFEVALEAMRARDEYMRRLHEQRQKN